jgi:hypothetical protein
MNLTRKEEKKQYKSKEEKVAYKTKDHAKDSKSRKGKSYRRSV